MKFSFRHGSGLDCYRVQPIVDLLSLLQDRHKDHLHSVVTLEVGYCVAVIPLVVALVRSYGSSLHQALHRTAADKGPVKMLESVKASKEVTDRMDECVCLRDAIEHTHIWFREISVEYDPASGSTSEYGDYELQPAYGKGDRFDRVVDRTTGRTRLLGLSAVPSELKVADLKTILSVCLEAVSAFESVFRAKVATERYTPFYPGDALVQYRGRMVTFREAIEAFCREG